MMSGYKRKERSGPSQGAVALYVRPANYKRRRANAGGPYYAPGPAGQPRIRARKGYMARTPGGQITSDNHYQDTQRTATSITTNLASWSGTEYDPVTRNTFFCAQQGDDISNRQGRKAVLKKIRINGIIDLPAQTAQVVAEEAVLIRIIFYQDMQTNGAQAQGEDLMATPAIGSEAISTFQNLANLGRFKVMYDKTFTFMTNIAGVSGSIVQPGQKRFFKISVKPNQLVNFNSTNGNTVADIVDHSWHLIANATSNSFATTIQYAARAVFTA